jgi:hypothetical protein
MTTLLTEGRFDADVDMPGRRQALPEIANSFHRFQYNVAGIEVENIGMFLDVRIDLMETKCVRCNAIEYALSFVVDSIFQFFNTLISTNCDFKSVGKGITLDDTCQID